MKKVLIISLSIELTTPVFAFATSNELAHTSGNLVKLGYFELTAPPGFAGTLAENKHQPGRPEMQGKEDKIRQAVDMHTAGKSIIQQFSSHHTLDWLFERQGAGGDHCAGSVREHAPKPAETNQKGSAGFVMLSWF